MGQSFDNGGDPAYLFGGSAPIHASWQTIVESPPPADWATVLANPIAINWHYIFANPVGPNWAPAIQNDAHNGAANGIDANTLRGLVISSVKQSTISPNYVMTCQDGGIRTAGGILAGVSLNVPNGNIVTISCYTSASLAGDFLTVERYNGSTWDVVAAAVGSGVGAPINLNAVVALSVGNNYRLHNNCASATGTFLIWAI
jgi:hypothetical protein